MRRLVIFFVIWALPWASVAQSASSGLAPLFADIALQSERDKLRQHLRDRTLGETLSLPLDPENEYRYQSACWAISQFMPADPRIEDLLRRCLQAYRKLETETRRAFLEALYTVHPPGFETGLQAILDAEAHPKLFAMICLYLQRSDPAQGRTLLAKLRSRWPAAEGHPILSSLQPLLRASEFMEKPTLPDVGDIFRYQRSFGIKTVYSFQRWDRNQPGLAAVQGCDGRFMRDSTGKLLLFRQLARSGSNLPYFITNGNTPQGVFSIQGIGQSANRFIGPTPNLQLTMPFEDGWKGFFQMPADTTEPQASYAYLLPESWRSYTPAWEAYTAGRAGRTEIIAHGTTIDPSFFRGQPYHPISPTLGCLCAPEDWDPQTGLLRDSEQLRLTEAFRQAPGPTKGYLIVLNMDDVKRPIERADIEPLLEAYERGQ